MSSMTIGALASAAAVRIDTIRYYERTGLLPAPARSGAGYRKYSASDLHRVQFIRRAQELGFTLSEIATLLSLRASDTARSADVLSLTKAKISASRARIAQLKKMKQALERLADSCPGDAPVSDCPIIAYMADSGPAVLLQENLRAIRPSEGKTL